MDFHRSCRWTCKGIAAHAFVVSLVQVPNAAAQITLDGSMGPMQVLAGPNFTIDATMGQVRGANLFHSFGKFNVRQGESATFTSGSPNAIANILGRVTGGEQSFINGLVRSQIAGAALYLFNPSGVAFGPNASLDVNGAFHVSTADYLRFADGAVVHASQSKPSQLTIAPPVAFGFLSPAPAPITFDRTLLQAQEGKTISVIGGDVRLDDTVLRARGGLIQMASAASPGEVVPAMESGIPQLHMQSFTKLGKVELVNDSNATTSGPAGAGTVLVRGGRLLLEGSFLNSNTTGTGTGAPLGVDVRVTDDVVMNGGQIVVFSFDGGSAGDVRIAASGQLQVANDGFINVENAGHLTIEAAAVEVSRGGWIGNQTNGLQQGGTLRLTTDKLTIATGDSPFFTGIFTGQFTNTGTARVGDLIVNANEITIAGSSGQGGLTGIFGQNFGPGSGGFVLVDGKSLQITGAAEISNTTFGPGPGGGLLISIDGPISIAGTKHPNRFTGVFSNARGSGPGGLVDVDAKSIVLTRGSSIQGLTVSSGDAGGATVKTGSLDISDGSGIFTNALFGSGNAGDLAVTADAIVIRGIRESITPFTSLSDFTGLSTTAGAFARRAGNLSVNAGSILVTDKGSITSLTAGAGDAGTLRIVAGDLTVKDLAQINASTLGAGRGGNIDIQAKSVLVSGAGAPRGPADAFFSGIGAQAQGGSGAAGDLTMDVGSLQVRDGGRMSVQTFGSGKGGNLTIRADGLLVSGINEALAAHERATGNDVGGGRSAIATSTERTLIGDAATGNAGNLLILGGDVRLDAGGALISRTTTPGRGGTLDVQADRVTLVNALVSAESKQSLTAGKAGDIFIRGRESVQIGTSAVTTAAERADGGAIGISGSIVRIDPGTLLSARASGAGNAGSIGISANNTIVAGQSTISTEATDGLGGNVTLAGPSVQLIETLVSAKASGAGTAGHIGVTANDAIVAQKSTISTEATDGSGGRVALTALTVNLIETLLSAKASGAGSAGSIGITAGNAIVVRTSTILTEATQGAGGDVTLTGPATVDLDDSLLSARAFGAGNAGNIGIVAGNAIVARNTVISTEATQSDGGNVTLLAPTMVHLVDTRVTTAVGTGQGKGGNITIDPIYVILDGAEMRADAFGGPGGNITLSADVFLMQDSILSASSALSTPGTIDIQARITDIGGDAARLPEGVAPPSVVLRAACATRLAGGTVSSLVLAGREGLPPDPGGLLPSPLLAVDPAAPMALASLPADRLSGLAKPVSMASACVGPRAR